ncbi:MAG: DUF1573 domain-containing protein [Bacteroidales bacterium]
MRIVIILSLALSLCISCGVDNSGSSGIAAGENGQLNEDGTAGIEFRSIRHDFGTVKHGEKLVYDFIYNNTGDASLVIHSARADCGCTVPEYDNKPLPPGGEGRIKVIFDTRGFRGRQTKTVQLLTNAENSVVTLAVRAMIE